MKEFLRKLSKFLARTPKKFASPDVGWEILKNIGWKSAKLLACLGLPYVSGWLLLMS